jgi:nitroreductase
MEVDEAIRKRRSIRKYTEEGIPDEHILKIIDAARWAPSWHNYQCWEFIVVKDPEIKSQIIDCVPPVNPGRKAVETAPLIIVALGKKGLSGTIGGSYITEKGDWLMFDVALATQNICLQAYSMGYGTLIIGVFDFKKVAEILGVPEDYEVVVLVTLGKPHKIPNPPERKEIREILHLDTFGNRYG